MRLPACRSPSRTAKRRKEYLLCRRDSPSATPKPRRIIMTTSNLQVDLALDLNRDTNECVDKIFQVPSVWRAQSLRMAWTVRYLDTRSSSSGVFRDGRTRRKDQGQRAETYAVGWPAIKQSVRIGAEEMGVRRGIKTLLKVNQVEGFDCPSCAWPDPDPEDRKTMEFCENGAKATSWEATTRSSDA